MTFRVLVILLSLTTVSSSFGQVQPCLINKEQIQTIVANIHSRTDIKRIPECAKANPYLVAELILLDEDYFNYASDNIKDDEEFISEFVAQNPKTLDYTSDRLKSDQFFFSRMVRFYPNALEYASPKLLDNKGYMATMIERNPKNFSYASERLQNDFGLAMLAVNKSGKMLKHASERLQNDPRIARAAIASYTGAIDFVGDRLRNDKSIVKLAQNNSNSYGFLDEFNFFLDSNYQGLPVGPNGSRGYRIVNMAQFFPKKQLVNRPYITKWQELSGNEKSLIKSYKLVSKIKNDYGWKIDFAKYPGLIKEIEGIFKNNLVDQNTIDSLNTVSLWQVSQKPIILAFDLYLLREVRSKYLKGDFSNVTLLSAIARKKVGKNQGWEISIIDAIFDANIRMDINYENGHKRHKIWDLYRANKKDKNPKVLIKVEDKDAEYFELFAPQPNGRYASIFRGGGYYSDNY